MALDGILSKTSTTASNKNAQVSKNTSQVFNNSGGGKGQLGGITDSVSGIQKNVAGTVVGAGNVVAKVGGALGMDMSSLTGSSKTKYNSTYESIFAGGLKGFYSQFSNASLQSIRKIDPFLTFECEFKFFPSVGQVKSVTKIETTTGATYDSDGTEAEGETKSTKRVGKTSLTNSLLDELLGKVKFKNKKEKVNSTKKTDRNNEREAEKIKKEADTTEGGEDITRYVKKTAYETIVEIDKDLYVNLGFYIQNIVLPNISINGEDEVTTLLGKFPVPGNLVIPDNNTFNMEIVNVEAPIQENIFYPWMRETTLPKWTYEKQPFTTATITIDMTEHSNVKYRFFGCRPTQIQLMQPSQQPNTSPIRNVTFAFDFMTIETIDTSAHKYVAMQGKKSSKKKSGSGSWDKIANSALFSATNSLKM